MWGKKHRPISPIEYDFRGRRVTPKRGDGKIVSPDDRKIHSQHTMPGPPPHDLFKKKAAFVPSYNPGTFTKISIKDQVDMAGEDTTITIDNMLGQANGSRPAIAPSKPISWSAKEAQDIA